ncbi:MAG: hypothetical protein U5R48_19540 [Gammaproteobacteria bacterium]|nr:hypothetical protein [Gammaproteobacteria bacterium]
MSNEYYKILKRQEPVTLWVHPDGPVKGMLYLQQRSDRSERTEQPIEVLNRDMPFVVLHCENPAETRFYGKRAIVRVHHEAMTDELDELDLTVIPCELRLMDGSSLKGRIREFLCPNTGVCSTTSTHPASPSCVSTWTTVKSVSSTRPTLSRRWNERMSNSRSCCADGRDSTAWVS